jgi:predicted ribosome quality control (RQC) complex YloA/Tae2 family protein
VGQRLAQVRERLPRLEEAAGRLERATTTRQVEELEEALAAAGLVRVVRRQRTRRQAAPPGSAPEILPVRSYLSADGMEVLMGRTGKENDLVTFKVAAPHDFWFHAQGFAGAHVVVRNPSRLGRLPEPTARQAAMLAAFHSKARGSARVDVIYTQRRHVRKGKNQPPGKVLVRKHETIQVSPEMPFDQEI